MSLLCLSAVDLPSDRPSSGFISKLSAFTGLAVIKHIITEQLSHFPHILQCYRCVRAFQLTCLCKSTLDNLRKHVSAFVFKLHYNSCELH